MSLIRQVEDTPHTGASLASALVPPRHTGRKPGAGTLLCESSAECVAWWDHEKNDEADFLSTLCLSRKKQYWWRCPECGEQFLASPLMAFGMRHCGSCAEKEREREAAELERLRHTAVSSIPELLEAWDDERDPTNVMVAPSGRAAMYRFRCPRGHHPRMQPITYYTNGCSACRSLHRDEDNPDLLANASPELSLEWDYDENPERLSPRNITIESRASVHWRCIACGHRWVKRVRDRNRGGGHACPNCGKVLNSLAWSYPRVASMWSNRNPVTPWQIYPGTKLNFIPEWVCLNNPSHVWNEGLPAMLRGGGCPSCRPSGRSTVADNYCGEASKLFPDIRIEAQVHHRSFSHNPWAVDAMAFYQGKRIALEYDGEHWHEDQVEVDKRKAIELMSVGYAVVRIREGNLPPLGIKNSDYLEIRVPRGGGSPSRVMKQVYDWVKTL